VLDARSLWHLVEERAAATPDLEMLVDDRGRRMTFGAYRTAVQRAAAGLAAHGVAAGTVVAWQLPTWTNSAVLMGALSRLGGVQVPLQPALRDAEVRFAIRHSGTDVLMVPGHWRGYDYPASARRIAVGQGDLQVLVVRGRLNGMALPDADPGGLPRAPVSPADPRHAPVRWVFAGSRATDAAVLDPARAVVRRQRLAVRDRLAPVFPIADVGGCVLLASALMSGCTLLLAEMSGPPTWRFLARERVTLVGLTDFDGRVTVTRQVEDLIADRDIRRLAACGRVS